MLRSYFSQLIIYLINDKKPEFSRYKDILFLYHRLVPIEISYSCDIFLIELVIPNMSKIYFCIPEIFKTNVSGRFYSAKLTFEFVGSC